LERARGVEADVVLANDVESLPAALALGPRVVFDAHEYAPLQFEDQWRFNLFWKRYKKYLCDTYVPRAEATMTVSEGIAERFEQDTGRRPSVVTNAPDYEDIRPAPRRSDDTIRLIHHGRLSASRRLGEMIRVMDFLDDRFELNLMLVQNDRAALERLRRSAKGNPRVRLLAPVPMRDIPKALNAFDVGLVLFPPVTFNLRHALPNKFFEFVQARLAIATGPSEEMAAIVHRYGLGIVSDDFAPESMAAALTALNRDAIEAFKQHAHEAAHALSAAGNSERLVQLVGECTG
jgi:glycosyltransferase involved in cell wall biosynthesis